jgi:DNA polymerase-3 subunit delta'
MTLLPLVGHEEAIARVREAVRRGGLPQTILLAGPAGVGRQRFALWAAQALLCERSPRAGGLTGRPYETAPGRASGGPPEAGDALPCGTCSACRRVLGLAHPDLHWFVPIPRPKSGEPDKQVDEASDLLTDLMAERRAQPLWTTPDGMSTHSVASARLLLRRAVMKSVEGGPKIFLIGDAERLVPQESSQEAANALLKLLEEPPPHTYFLLTTSDPRRVLPTIRSRSIVLRLGRVTDAAVRDFLRANLEPAPSGAALEARVAAAEGAIGQALAETGQKSKARESAAALVEAITKGGAEPWERALRQNAWQARGEFTEMLDALAELLSDAAREAVRQEAGSRKPEAGSGRLGTRDPRQLVRAAERVQGAREAAQGNVNPQLLLAALSDDLEEALCP